jgi:hypothetical protein
VRALALALLTGAVLAGAEFAQSASEGPSMQCDVGPLTKSYGGSNWLVYGCVDQQTLVAHRRIRSISSCFNATVVTNCMAKARVIELQRRQPMMI